MPISPLESLETTARDLSRHFLDSTHKILTDGWKRDGFGIPSIYPPIEWGAHNRSFSYRLHSWSAIADLLIRYDRFRERAYFDACLAHSRAWLELFQAPLLGKDSPEQLDALVRPTMPVEWYDMAVGLRVYRIAYMLDCLLNQAGDDRDIELFRESLKFHLKLLKREHFFRRRSNHGFYQALGQLAAARRFRHLAGFSEDFELGRSRVQEILEAHFAPDGVHREHSPAYHFMLLGTIINARRTGLTNVAKSDDFVGLMESALTWMVTPNWGIATIGDSDPRIMVREEGIAKVFVNPGAQYIFSGGTLGTVPRPGVQPFYSGGYAFARLYANDLEQKFENASYLAQTAGFHSRVHKQADHLSFIWFDRGREILIDPGRYAYLGKTEVGSDLFNQGFWYDDPKRIYVESTRAHNCVEIDSKSYPRRSATPFGSALRYAGQQEDLAVTDCEVTHLRTVRHRRTLVMAPGHFLLVLDWLNDRTGPHVYKQWFQFAPVWTLSNDGERIVAQSPGLAIAADGELASPKSSNRLPRGDRAFMSETLTVFNLVNGNSFGKPVRGQDEPQLQGWTSDAAHSLTPCSSLAVDAPVEPMGRFATFFVFGDDVALDHNNVRLNTTLRAGTVTWTDGRGRHRLTIKLGEPGQARARMRTES